MAFGFSFKGCGADINFNGCCTSNEKEKVRREFIPDSK
jgi:hypothetical protein